jgi:RND family efflux transporter MFP subunit
MLSFTKHFTFFIVSLALANAAPVVAQKAKYSDSYSIEGFSQPYRFANVAAPIGGIVSSIDAKEGEQVAEGDCLAQLDSKSHQGRVEVARVAKESLGELATAEAQLVADKTRLQRILELSGRHHATAVELLQAKEDVAIAEAGVVRAKDRLDQQAAEYQRLIAESEQYSIRAPFSGVIVEYAKDRGEYVGPGDSTICTIADLSTLRAEFLVPRDFRHKLHIGHQAKILFTVARKTTTGTIEYISPFPNGETSTFTVKMIVDNSAGLLSAGERCQIQDLSQPITSSQPDKDQQLSMREQ